MYSRNTPGSGIRIQSTTSNCLPLILAVGLFLVFFIRALFQRPRSFLKRIKWCTSKRTLPLLLLNDVTVLCMDTLLWTVLGCVFSMSDRGSWFCTVLSVWCSLVSMNGVDVQCSVWNSTDFTLKCSLWTIIKKLLQNSVCLTSFHPM